MGGYATATDTNESSEISGSGTANYVAKFSAAQVIANSSIFDDGSVVGIGTATPGADLGIIKSTSGSPVWMRILNSSATAGSDARLQIRTEDAGDAYMFYTNQTLGTNWYTGLDSSTGGFTIGMDPSTPVPGTADAFRISSIGSITQLKYTATGLTASTENVGFQINTVSKTFATGALTTQRENFFRAPTYAFAGASTLSEAYNLYLEAPIAGTNATITNNFALGLLAGTSTIKFGNITGSTSLPAIYLNQATPSATNFTIAVSAVATRINAGIAGGTLNFQTAGSDRMILLSYQMSTVFAGASGGSLTAYAFSSPSYTAQTASVEANYISWAAAAVQFSTGALTTQRHFLIDAPTYSFVGASTITSAYGLYVNAPIAGTNATITTAYGIGTNGRVQGLSFRPNGYTETFLTDHLGTGILGTQGSTGNGDLELASNSATRGLTFYINGTSGTVISTWGPAATSGTSNQFAWSGASTTGQTASTEISGYLYNSYSRTWATGAITTQREQYIKTVTLAFAGASTITNAYGMYIEAPTAGANATITNNYALGLSGGLHMVTGRIVGSQGADVASATNVTLGTDGNAFEITGTTTIDLILITGWQNGSVVELVFNESLTVRHGIATSGSNVTILLAGAANFSATANDTLTLMLCETTAGGQAWRETARTVI